MGVDETIYQINTKYAQKDTKLFAFVLGFHHPTKKKKDHYNFIRIGKPIVHLYMVVGVKHE